MNKRVTIKDVAKLANVSVATAGRVIGQYGHYSQESRSKVLKAAQSLSFHPNVFAQSLRSSSMKTIGVVFSDIQNTFSSVLLSSVERRTREYGYMPLVCNSDDDLNMEAELLRALVWKNVDGIILVSAYAEGAQIERKNREIFDVISVPIVFVDKKMPGMEHTIVEIDNRQGGFDATAYLLGLGHKNIGFIAPSRMMTIIDRLAGCRDALMAANIPIADENVIQLNRKSADITSTLRKWLRAHPEITAYITLNNVALTHFLTAMKKTGRSFPLDYSLVSWDDSSLTEYLDITTISQPVDTMGTLVVDKLVSYINQKDDEIPVERSMLRAKLTQRSSCRAV